MIGHYVISSKKTKLQNYFVTYYKASCIEVATKLRQLCDLAETSLCYSKSIDKLLRFHIGKLEEMGGTVSVESTVGEGSCFTLHLPWAVKGSEETIPQRQSLDDQHTAFGVQRP